MAAGAVLASPQIGRAQAKSIRVGLIPSEDSRAMLASSKQLLEALEKNLGIKVQGFVAADYNGVIEAMRSNHVEVAYLGPFSYVLGTTVADIEAFATAETSKSGRTFYHSQIITRNDSGIKDIKDLKGRTFAFVDPSSTSGHLFPKAGLIKHGHRPGHVFRPRALHRLARRQRARGRQQARRCRDDRRSHLRCRGAEEPGQARGYPRRVELRSDPGIADRAGARTLPDDLKAKIKTAFLNIRDITWADQGKLNRFVETNDAAYDVIRDTAKALNLDLKKMK